MAESKRYGVSTQLDIGQILLEARNRWLRPAEICEVLRNYQQFRIAPGPPNKPPSGSLFLFDRKVLRYFRKDGHNWRKKKDGKTVKEAHERLKAGSVDVVHCYYAHGEDNENFQRRSYWMLEEEFEHIVLVHYREVKGNKLSFVHTRDTNETLQNSQISSPVHSTSLHTNQSKVFSQALDTSSLNSAQTSEYEDAESDNHQANSRYHPLLELQQSDESSVTNHVDFGLLKTNFQSNQCDYGNHLTVPGVDFVSLGQGNTSENNSAGFQINFHESNRQMDMPPWADAFGECTMGFQTTALRPYLSSDQAVSMEGMPNKQVNLILEQLFTDDLYIKQEAAATPDTQAEWQIASEKDSSNVSTWPMDQKLPTESAYELSPSFQEHKDQQITESSFLESGQKNDFLMQIKDTLLTEVGCLETSNLDAVDGFNIKDRANSPCTPKRSLLDCSSTEEGLKKFDSFSRWMSKELGDADESLLTSSSGIYWETIESGNMAEDSNMSHQVHLDVDLLSPSLSQDQLFSILDFSPNWAYSGSETKVLITGTFLRNQKDVEKCKWSCMFGEVEAPAEILAPGVLRCHAPPYTPGRIPFYITCSNRLACSEIREFEYRFSHNSSVDAPDLWAGSTDEMLLHLRLGKLLSARSNADPKTSASSFDEKPNIRKKISSLLNENDDIWLQMVKLTREKDFSLGKVKDQLLQKLLKEKLHSWLLLKVVEDGKGPNILDKEGQGVLHLACALGYDWAIAPTIAAGVNINFRDMHGWTALHWAAFCGRERTVAALVSLGGESGALTDPTPEFPSGRTPADLASSNGHKGIAGYLAESSLTRHLSSLTLKEASRDSDLSVVSGEKSVEVSAEQSECNGGDVQDGLSLKDSLTAVRNAAQAAARIHEVFRVQSFHRKQLIEYGDDKFGISDEQALSLISVQKPHRSGQHNEPVHTAAIRIQNKFRGWKGRKEFLIIRQRIVKIQAHVRGHQVRKHYRKIVWSVGIVDKAILRWRRKGCGLRGFRPEGLIESSVMQCGPSNEDDYDFLKEGRKQTEARMEKALARVKSMVQYPEARDQYRRLLTVVTELQETKVGSEDDVIELQVEEEDQIFMSTG